MHDEKNTTEERAGGEHYVCLGGCRGVSRKSGVCGAPGCAKHTHALEKCECTDELHNDFQPK